MKGKNAENNLPYKAAEFIYSVFSALLIYIMCVFMVFTLFLRLVRVEGDSMRPTLYHGDRIIVSDFLYTPEYGNIIVIGKTSAEEKSLIKRVIALPGDKLMIDFKSHLITVNGKVIFENYKVEGAISEEGDLSYPLTVPDDCVFVLGDNRNNSIDSRFKSVGFVKLDEITGKALFRIFPPGKSKIY